MYSSPTTRNPSFFSLYFLNDLRLYYTEKKERHLFGVLSTSRLHDDDYAFLRAFALLTAAIRWAILSFGGPLDFFTGAAAMPCMLAGIRAGLWGETEELVFVFVIAVDASDYASIT